MAKDVVFPTRTLKRQLSDANRKLREMEDELQQLKAMKEDANKRRRSSLVSQHA